MFAIFDRTARIGSRRHDRLRRSERINKWLGPQIGPQAHTVKREDFPALLNALRQLGILPLFEGHEKDDWP